MQRNIWARAFAEDLLLVASIFGLGLAQVQDFASKLQLHRLLTNARLRLPVGRRSRHPPALFGIALCAMRQRMLTLPDKPET